MGVKEDVTRGICNHSCKGTLPPGSLSKCTSKMLGLPLESILQLSVNYVVLEQSPLRRLNAAGLQEVQEQAQTRDVIKGVKGMGYSSNRVNCRY